MDCYRLPQNIRPELGAVNLLSGGSGKLSGRRGIRIEERSVKAVGGIVGRSFRCHVR
jgi:hypothetical protein